MRGVPPPPLRPVRHRRNPREGEGLVLAVGRGIGRCGEHRMRPVTEAAGRGSSVRLAGSRPEGVPKVAAPPTASRPALAPAAYSGLLWPLILLVRPRPLLAVHVQAVRPGAPKVRP